MTNSILSNPCDCSLSYTTGIIICTPGCCPTVDLLLETNLKTFIETSNSLTFLAVLEEENSTGHDHCLWMGLIGSKPGHPVLRLAIEHIVGLAVQAIRDKDIFEGLICQNDRTKLWKFRSIDTKKTMFGSCALGRAFNQVLGRTDPFDGLSVSHFPDPETEKCYMKILLVSCLNFSTRLATCALAGHSCLITLPSNPDESK